MMSEEREVVIEHVDGGEEPGWDKLMMTDDDNCEYDWELT